MLLAFSLIYIQHNKYQYGKDPVKYPDAQRYSRIKYIDVLKDGLKVMDATAISLCMENSLPIVVFNSLIEGNIKKLLLGEDIGTTVEE